MHCLALRGVRRAHPSHTGFHDRKQSMRVSAGGRVGAAGRAGLEVARCVQLLLCMSACRCGLFNVQLLDAPLLPCCPAGLLPCAEYNGDLSVPMVCLNMTL